MADLEQRVEALEKRPAPTARGEKSDEDKGKEREAGQLLRKASQEFNEGDYAAAKATLAELDQKFGDTSVAQSSKRLEQQVELIGKPAGDLEVTQWYQGNTSFDQGDATLVVFWETWCPHCRREVPKIQGTYEKYKAEGLNVVGVTKGTRNVSDEDIRKFIEENEVGYPMAKEAGDLSRHFAVRGIPAAAVVKDGKVVWRGHPARLTDDMIQGWISG